MSELEGNEFVGNWV